MAEKPSKKTIMVEKNENPSQAFSVLKDGIHLFINGITYRGKVPSSVIKNYPSMKKYVLDS